MMSTKSASLFSKRKSGPSCGFSKSGRAGSKPMLKTIDYGLSFTVKRELVNKLHTSDATDVSFVKHSCIPHDVST